MTDAYKNYHNTFMAEAGAIIHLLEGLLHGQSGTAEEINQQVDQHFSNMDTAAAKYYADMQLSWSSAGKEKEDQMSRYKEYIQRVCRNGKYTADQADQQAISREVAQYYETEPETAPRLRNEFNCLSET